VRAKHGEETEVDATSKSSLESSCSPRDAEASNVGSSGTAAVVGPALRFALNAPPCGLRRAALRAGPTGTKINTKEEQSKIQKGDISKLV
jgi:hypothetical protein